MSKKQVMVCNTCKQPIVAQYNLTYLVDAEGNAITTETESYGFNNYYCYRCFEDIFNLSLSAHVAEIDV